MEGSASEQCRRTEGRPSVHQPRIDRIDDPALNYQVSATSPQSFTPRSLLVGLIIGALITFSNTYFGLQTGWISTMAMPSALIGFSVFKVLSKHLSFPFTPVENVLIQTVAGAVGTMPLGCGFVGVIPALEFLLKPGEDGPEGDGGEGEGGPLKLGFWKLVIWSLGVCLFGVVFAVPLRKEVIIREKLRFPSGTASALMLKVLHSSGGNEKVIAPESFCEGTLSTEPGAAVQLREDTDLLKDGDAEDQASKEQDWRSKMRILVGSFALSGTLFSYFVPLVHAIPLFGVGMAKNWLWTLNPSPAYIGQGIIMGPSTCMHMLFGAVLGWGVLSPLAKTRGWAPGPVNDWDTGSKAWIVWISLAIMLADSLVSLGWLLLKPIVNHFPRLIAWLRSTRAGQWIAIRLQSSQHSYVNYSTLESESHGLSNDNDDAHQTLVSTSEEDDAPRSQLISTRTVVILLPLTLLLNVICMHFVFGEIISPFLSTLATLLAVLLSIMGVRALGETDLNPVSGISKLTQLLFSLATPASQFSRRTALVTNLLAGAVSESGALQAGDMMQDLKTGHLLGASPKAQFYGQIIGSLVGAVLSTAVYKLYVNVYEIPGEMFQTPTAYVWIFTARLVTGQGLPSMAGQVSLIAGIVWVFLTALRIAAASPAYARDGNPPAWRAWIPGGIAVAVGIFNEPSFTLARAIGGIIAWWWARKNSESKMDQLVANGNASSMGSSIETELQDGQRSSETAEQAFEKTDAASSTVVVLASGLILGEGIMSIVNLLLASGHVQHL
ncbi:Oligonucleotide transporter [Penicillium digitatum Pd1]|uniref:Oligonucleotide transporter n=1 Tax=Penicillium digitatum (strain Pd1 / CECT 20795) TaxID=1170230 RepID=K9GUY9_PEND1|nr:Oligonucleotide transporter [Penicillium digitatum Pd1]EKV18413.1 Oligonucleotide transporter [Penicillium digitatum Pd1]